MIELEIVNVGSGYQDHWTIPVKIQGRSAHAVIDTGCTFSAIRPRFAKELGVKPVDDEGAVIGFTDIHGKTHRAKLAEADFSIGPHRLDGTLFALYDSDPYADFEVLLGLDILRDFGRFGFVQRSVAWFLILPDPETVTEIEPSPRGRTLGDVLGEETTRKIFGMA